LRILNYSPSLATTSPDEFTKTTNCEDTDFRHWTSHWATLKSIAFKAPIKNV